MAAVDCQRTFGTGRIEQEFMWVKVLLKVSPIPTSVVRPNGIGGNVGAPRYLERGKLA